MAASLLRSGPMRRLAWRLGRKLYADARGDGRNDPSVNGEYWLLRWMLDAAVEPVVLVDVGANRGDWTAEAVRRSGSRALRVHALEPASATRHMLEERFRHVPQVQIHGLALSDREGEASFFLAGEGCGTNSLSAQSGPSSELVEVSTLDRFLARSGSPQVRLAKIDAEGFDALILRGALESLRSGRIDTLQFEYNWRWLLNRCSLRDVFELLEGLPYRFGKLVEESIEFYAEWHPELDRYFENNYLLVRTGAAGLPPGREMRFDRSNSAVPAHG